LSVIGRGRREEVGSEKREAEKGERKVVRSNGQKEARPHQTGVWIIIGVIREDNQ